MHWLTRRVSIFCLYPVMIFSGIALLPWREFKTGDRLPIATAYANSFPGWQSVLLVHLAATAVLGFVAVGLHLAFARQVRPKGEEQVWEGRA